MKKEEVLKEYGPNKTKTIVYFILTIIFMLSIIVGMIIDSPLIIIASGISLFIWFAGDFTWRVYNYEYFLKYGKNYKREFYLFVYGTETKILKTRLYLGKFFIIWIPICIILPIINMGYFFIVLVGTGVFLIMFWMTFDIPKEVKGT